MSVGSHAVVRTTLTVEPLVASVEGALRASGEGCGAVCTFVGVVRATHQGRRVRFLDYEAHGSLALKMLDRISAEVSAKWPNAMVVVHHRVGRLEIGETSVAIAAASAHRAEAFQVCRYTIERVKQIVPVWKHEFFEDGDAWVEGPLANPDDEEMRQQALGRACA
jgi:molybdopterin synthase catalytic subunit